MKKKFAVRKQYNRNIYTIPRVQPNGIHVEDKLAEADFETAISATGFGKFNLILLIVSIPSGWAAMFDTNTMSYVLPAAHCDLDLNLPDRGLLNASTYLGMITSAFVWGFLADTLGRKKILILGYLLDACFVFLAGISQNFAMILVAKYMTGFIVNGPLTAFTTMMSEFHCAKYRARVLMFIGVTHTSATLVLPLIAWPILPTNLDVELFEGSFKLHSWNFFIILCALPSFLSCLAHSFLPESPKFLMTVGRNEAALKVFKRVYSCNTGRPPDTYPVKNLVDEIKLQVTGKHGGIVTANRSKTQALKEGWQQLTPLFFPPHVIKLVLVCTIQFGFMIGTNTLRLWLPQIFTAMNDYQQLHPEDEASLCEMLEIIMPNQNETLTECVVNTVSDSVYTNAIIVAGVGILGYLCVGVLINSLGKKTVILALGVVSGSCSIAIYFARYTWTTIALSAVATTFAAINCNVLMTVIVDLFPTSLRGMAISVAMMIGRSGTMTGNLLFPYLLQTGCLPPFFMIGFLTIGCALLSIALPKTDLKPLE